MEKTMTKFSDQLYTDLMREHAETLLRTELPAASRGHLTGKRAAWVAGGAGTLAVGITAGLAAFGGSGGAAYAVTPHSDGTVTVGISKLSGIAGANAALTSLGERVVVVPVKAGCPSLDSLPAPAVRVDKASVSGTVSSAKDGTITVDAHGIPQGDLMVLAVDDTGQGISIAAGVHSPPVPSCVSLPAGFPAPGGPGTGSRHGGGQGSFSQSGSGSAGGTGKDGSQPSVRQGTSGSSAG
jgi:hypothetical protein